FPLVVRLTEFHVDAVAFGGGAAELLDILQRRAAVLLGLARAEQVHIRAVKNVDGLRHVRDAGYDHGSAEPQRPRPRVQSPRLYGAASGRGSLPGPADRPAGDVVSRSPCRSGPY